MLGYTWLMYSRSHKFQIRMDDFHVVSGHSKNTGASPRQTSLQNSTYLSPPPPTYSTLVIASFLHLGTRFQNWGPFFLVELIGHNWNPFIYSVIALGHLPSVHLIFPQFCKEIFFLSSFTWHFLFLIGRNVVLDTAWNSNYVACGIVQSSHPFDICYSGWSKSSLVSLFPLLGMLYNW